LNILRQPSLSEVQYVGCVSAFVDALAGELNAAAAFLKRLEGSGKGSGFTYEIGLDRGRYGALVVLDRWRHLSAAFGPHLRPGVRDPALGDLIEEAERRVTAGETILARVNEMIDAAGGYPPEMVEAALLGFQQVQRIFQQESDLAERAARLGPLMPEEQKAARTLFLADLAQR
jgi:hypothetical protein